MAGWAPWPTPCPYRAALPVPGYGTGPPDFVLRPAPFRRTASDGRWGQASPHPRTCQPTVYGRVRDRRTKSVGPGPAPRSGCPRYGGVSAPGGGSGFVADWLPVLGGASRTGVRDRSYRLRPTARPLPSYGVRRPVGAGVPPPTPRKPNTYGRVRDRRTKSVGPGRAPQAGCPQSGGVSAPDGGSGSVADWLPVPGGASRTGVRDRASRLRPTARPLPPYGDGRPVGAGVPPPTPRKPNTYGRVRDRRTKSVGPGPAPRSGCPQYRGVSAPDGGLDSVADWLPGPGGALLGPGTGPALQTSSYGPDPSAVRRLTAGGGRCPPHRVGVGLTRTGGNRPQIRSWPGKACAPQGGRCLA